MATLPRTLTRSLRTEGQILETLRHGRGSVLGMVRGVLTKAVRGTVTLDNAIAAVQAFFDPKRAPHTLAGGPLATTGTRLVGLLPGAAGYQARRIMVTEATRAHAEARRELAREKGYLLRWVLAASHPRIDACDDLASRDEGYGAGVYEPGREPPCPAHPLCRCSLAVIEPDAAQMAKMDARRGL